MVITRKKPPLLPLLGGGGRKDNYPILVYTTVLLLLQIPVCPTKDEGLVGRHHRHQHVYGFILFIGFWFAFGGGVIVSVRKLWEAEEVTHTDEFLKWNFE